MEQLSHQTLNSTLMVSDFAAFMGPPGFLCFGRFLEARYGGRGVVPPMTTHTETAGQHQFLRALRLKCFCPVAAIQRKENRHLALLTLDSEIPDICC